MREILPSSRVIRFGLFEADLAAAELRKNGLKVKLQDRPFEILRILLERPGEVITREEFRQRLWPADTFVDFDHSLNASINKLRQALDDEAENPRFVATAGRRGYRFIAPATTADRSVPSESAGLSPAPALPDAPAAPSGTKLWRRIVPIATLLAMASAAFFWRFPWRARAALGETDSVLVADFVNATGDPVFDGSLKQALTVKLSESPYFNVLLDSKTRETLQLMGRSSDERVVPPVSREICQRAGAKVLIGGSIVAVGNKYAVSLDSTNCLTGASFSHDEVKAESKETVLTALGQIIPKLRRNLGESLASLHRFDTPIEQATTPSLAALKAYTQGDKMRAEGKEAESIPLYKMAIDLDPNFAIAYARLGAVYSNLQDQTNEEKYLKLGFERRSHISEREKFYIAAHYYVDGHGRDPQSHRHLRALDANLHA